MMSIVSLLFSLLLLLVQQSPSLAFHQSTSSIFRNSFTNVGECNNHQIPSLSPTTSTTVLKSLLRADENDNILDYLKNRGEDIPPDMKEVVKEATIQQTTERRKGNHELIGGTLLDVIEFEYKISTRSFMIGNNVTYSNKPNIYRILAVCLFHQLPASIVCQLMENVQNCRAFMDDDEVLTISRQALESNGWKAISFPDGIRVQLRPGQVCSTWKSCLPPRKVTKDMADKLIEQAEMVEPPAVIRTSTVLEALKKEFSVPSSIVLPIRGAVPFFPQDNMKYYTVLKRRSKVLFKRLRRTFKEQLKRFRLVLARQAELLNVAGRAGFLAYGFLNFALYAGGTLWQWHRVPGGQTLQSQIQKLGKVLASVYIGSQVTKLPRIALAVALAPFGNRSLVWLQNRLGVSEGTAFGILTVGLISSFFGVLAFLTIGSAVIS